MAHPVVIQESKDSHRDLLSRIVDSTLRGTIHTFGSFEECRAFTDQQRVRFVLMELRPDSDERIDWIRDLPDDVIGVIDWEWSEEQLTPYVHAGLSDYIFKPYQPERIVQLVEGRNG